MKYNNNALWLATIDQTKSDTYIDDLLNKISQFEADNNFKIFYKNNLPYGWVGIKSISKKDLLTLSENILVKNGNLENSSDDLSLLEFCFPFSPDPSILGEIRNFLSEKQGSEAKVSWIKYLGPMPIEIFLEKDTGSFIFG